MKASKNKNKQKQNKKILSVKLWRHKKATLGCPEKELPSARRPPATLKHHPGGPKLQSDDRQANAELVKRKGFALQRHYDRDANETKQKHAFKG